jgi:probable F420-dependent oxidoreductase
VEVGVGIAYQARTRQKAVALAVAAEGLGYHSLWVGEHIALPVTLESRYPFSADGTAHFDHTQHFPEAMVMLGFLAGVTERLRLGTSVIPTITRDPLSLAKQAATVDLFSDGRLELGLGSGWCLEEAAALGRPTDHKTARLGEMVEIMRKAWTQDAVEHHGRFYDFPPFGVHPHPPQGADLPIWIGGVTQRLRGIMKEQGTNAMLPSRRLDLVATVREELPAGQRVAAVVGLSGDFGEDREHLSELRELGVDRLIIGLDWDPDVALVEMGEFAAQVLPVL